MDIPELLSPSHKSDRQIAVEALRRITHSDPLFLDTETTGLGDTAEIVDLAVLDLYGAVLLETFVQPVYSIPPEASRIHGITNEHVKSAPGFQSIYPDLTALLTGRSVVIYNADFDKRMIEQALFISTGLETRLWARCAVSCLMLHYADYRGEWNPRYRNYRWHRLEVAAQQMRIEVEPGSLHRAKYDADLVRRIFLKMLEG